jgi:hypothetical protein
MEDSMRKAISAGMTAIAVIAAPSITHAQSQFREAVSERVTAADLNALTDARIAIVKSALQLTPDQEKYWPATIRSRVKNRETRMESVTTGVAQRAERSALEHLRDRSPIDFLYAGCGPE